MKKVFLSLPKPLLRRYVLNHFSELSVDDFFQVITKVDIPSVVFEKNNVLRANPDVLNHMLDIDPYAFLQFESKALSNECIDKIANSNIQITAADVTQFPILLKNPIICENAIKNDEKLVKQLDGSQITPNIIHILEEGYYVPDNNDFDKSELFLESEKLMSRAIDNNPALVLRVEKPTPQLLKMAFDKGFIPKKQDFLEHQYLCNADFLKKAFEQDPSVIIFFKVEWLTNEVIESALKRGFVATENDLLYNPSLCENRHIMESAITNNPKLVTLMTKEIYIDNYILKNALQQYKITKEDLEKNPSLTRIKQLMEMVPEFKLFSQDLTSDEKVSAIEDSLKKSYVLSTEALPFLDEKFGGIVNVNEVNELLQYFKTNINEEDLNLQQNYLKALDMVIDGIVDMRYMQGKQSFKFPDIVTLHDYLVKQFDEVLRSNDYGLLSKCAKELESFTGGTIPYEYLNEQVLKYFNEYINNNLVTLSTTSNFCNMVLNQHRNYFTGIERLKILANIEEKMKLTSKKTATILSGKKIKKINDYIMYGDYQKFGITKEQFIDDIRNVLNAVMNNSEIKKHGITMDSSQIGYISFCFINGSLDDALVNKILGIDNNEVSKFIVKKLEQIKYKYINNVNLTEEESYISKQEKSKLGGLNQTNYVIGDNERCMNNLSKMILNIDEKNIAKILDNKSSLGEIAFLLPFVDLIEELNTETFINMLSNYDRIKDKIGSTIDVSKDNGVTMVLKHINALVCLADAYGSIDDITKAALGKNVASAISVCNCDRYLDYYKKMLEKDSGNIPPIKLETDGYYLESGVYSDPERLLIGDKFSLNMKPGEHSCIQLGSVTADEALLEKSGDVILIRDAQKNLLSRILLFRRGNVIQMVTNASDKYTIGLYESIAKQIMEQSINSNDNIDYVFVNNTSCYNASDFDVVSDSRFISEFPHADFSGKAILLSSKKKMQGLQEERLDLDFKSNPAAIYEKSRKQVSYHPSADEITRLRALRIKMESDLKLKETMARNFEPFYSDNYNNVFCGEDWYIAVKKDGTIEEFMMPTHDARTNIEIETIKNKLGISLNAAFDIETQNNDKKY